MSEFAQRFGGIARLYGADVLQQFRRAHVAVVGIGGVGSWSVEALARSGIGKLTLVDLDDICTTNTNRQVHATASNVGRLKVDAMKTRAQEINPEIVVESVPEFLTAVNVEKFLSTDFDCVLDAIDNVGNKCQLLAACSKKNISIVTTGAAGGRRDMTQIRTADLNHVTHDPLIKQVRKQLRRSFSFPEDPKVPFGIPCVYSTEPVRFPWSDGSVCEVKEPGAESLRLDCQTGYGTATFLTGAFGFAAAAEVLSLLSLRVSAS